MLLEVAVLHARDAAAAETGGADRLLVVGAPGATSAALSPEPALVSSVTHESSLPVRVPLRLDDSWSTTTAGLDRLAGLAESYRQCGASGVSLGLLDADLEVDLDACRRLVEAMPDLPWTFDQAIDASLDARRSWRRLLTLPGLTAVCSAGSPRGMAEGYDDLLAAAESSADVARLLMPGPGLQAEHVPWLVRAGVRQLHLGPQVRPGGTAKAYVDADHVRSWRLLADHGVPRA